MKKWLVWLILLCFPVLSVAESESAIGLETFQPNLHDRASIKRGGKFFANTCMVCHTLIYMRYNKLANKVGVIYDKMPIHITKWPLDVKPPDLSLEVSRRGASWVYTYLHSFYVDPSRPTGSNNLVLQNTAMTNILAAFQGVQQLVPEAHRGEVLYHPAQWYNLVKQKTPGNMTPAQFDATIADVVTFLAYASEPYKIQQECIGKWVLGFLSVMLVLAYLLKKSYWKAIKRSQDERS